MSYRALCDIRAHLCPKLPPMPDFTELTTDWIEDLSEIVEAEERRRVKREQEREEERRRDLLRGVRRAR